MTRLFAGSPVDTPKPLAFFLDFEPKTSDFGADVLEGLTASPRAISPKYLYDERGSALFDAICETPEYYVTRTERAILRERAAEIALFAGPNAAVIELGSGSSVKIRTLLSALDQPALYAAIDISRDHLLNAAAGIAQDFPDVRTGAVCADFTQPLPRLDDAMWKGSERRLAFFPGSTIGNFPPAAAEAILHTARGLLFPGDGLLLGYDLKKDVARLEAAYNDAGGVTASFSLNLLTRINRELDGDIDVSAFAHRAAYSLERGGIETHLAALRDVSFTVSGQRFSMTAGDAIHIENSHKFDIADMEALTKRAGFSPLTPWTDSENLFCVQLFEAA